MWICIDGEHIIIDMEVMTLYVIKSKCVIKSQYHIEVVQVLK